MICGVEFSSGTLKGLILLMRYVEKGHGGLYKAQTRVGVG